VFSDPDPYPTLRSISKLTENSDPDPYQSEKSDPDPEQSEKQDPDPDQSEKQDPDPYQNGLDPQHCLRQEFERLATILWIY
jgi:hypothetical protein